MITLTPKTKNENILTIKVDPNRIARGHMPHRSGNGIHQHRGNKRHNTRNAQVRRALRDD